ncbi:PepSY domain-containing protein [Sulfurimonas lithotrophica]|uniref:PepSY domain-containing protein n=1 Tax=Sulfurimonas lithotrophica TaxID=2590022 RepID=A0A5P8NYU6_9BACT|nr:PepSY-associated TM helix domain-containing protein [Sulfurimonas lithotrophica]QFR48613.1 PepSY domain-containing protein [Sulfurimonas lithotrophica]
MKIRNIFVKVHLYLSLFLGIILGIVGITGSIIVFDEALDKILNPDILSVSTRGEYKSATEILKVAKSVYPNKHSAIIHPPKEPGDVFIVWFKVAKDSINTQKYKCCSSYNWYQVMVNPVSGKVLGKRNHSKYGLERRHIIKTMHGLHSYLLMGSLGRNIIGIAGILWLVITITGLYLWWPKNRKFKMALSIKKDANPIRFNFDLHRVSGVYSLIIVFVVTFTGVYIVYPQYFKPVVNVFSPIEDSSKSITSKVLLNDSPISVEKALLSANKIFPDAKLMAIGLPIEKQDTYRIYKRQEGEVRKSKGKSVVWIDQYNGEIIKVKSPKSMSAGETFINWQFPLHTGEAFGMAGRLLVFASGVVTLLLVITGTIIWYRKKRVKYLKLLKQRS